MTAPMMGSWEFHSGRVFRKAAMGRLRGPQRIRPSGKSTSTVGRGTVVWKTSFSDFMMGLN